MLNFIMRLKLYNSTLIFLIGGALLLLLSSCASWNTNTKSEVMCGVEKVEGGLHIDTAPKGVSVYVKGKLIGKTPIFISDATFLSLGMLDPVGESASYIGPAGGSKPWEGFVIERKNRSIPLAPDITFLSTNRKGESHVHSVNEYNFFMREGSGWLFAELSI